jgi:signal transduction histidine kinase
MFVARGSYFVNLSEIFAATTFRLALAFAGFFAGASLLLFAFIYWNTAIFETRRIDQLIATDAKILATEPTDVMMQVVSTRVTNDFHRVAYAGLFDARGNRIAGNLASLPAGLAASGDVALVKMIPFGSPAQPIEAARAVMRHLPNGDALVIGRNSESVQRLRDVVLRALTLGVIPLVVFSLVAGIFLSWRAQKRVHEVHKTAESILRGHLRERLPTRGGRDDFDRLAMSVNRMLDEIERLLDQLRATGDEIAHDLRTPLTRVRARLERGMSATESRAQLEGAVEHAIVGLDQALSVITALLRIREIEAGRRRSGFGGVDLSQIVTAIEDLYQPIAEEKNITLVATSVLVGPVRGDKDLLIEAVGNLIDNAIKFTPPGGVVSLALLDRDGRPVVRVADSGPGIAPPERDAVFARFYRSEISRKFDGAGLGLSLVAAIASLHEIDIVVEDNGPGCIVELRFRASQ